MRSGERTQLFRAPISLQRIQLTTILLDLLLRSEQLITRDSVSAARCDPAIRQIGEQGTIETGQRNGVDAVGLNANPLLED